MNTLLQRIRCLPTRVLHAMVNGWPAGLADESPRTLDPAVAAINAGDRVKIVDEYADGSRVTIEGIAQEYDSTPGYEAWVFANGDEITLYLEHQPYDLKSRSVERFSEVTS